MKHARLFLVLLLSSVWLAATADVANSTFVKSAIVKSENDDRVYQYLVLPNHLRVLLISDPHTEKSAASLDVNAGSGDEPSSRPGLAHFLEHMLFLGTRKYPKSGEYQEFINAHGGNHNAYTSLEHTNYFFDIDPQYLDETLDRFAQFFVAPLLDATYVDRERNAVHSEYTAKYKEEYRRQWDALGEVTNPENKSAHFTVGTQQTLADRPDDKVRDDLLGFYQSHYAASHMTLVVLGKESPEQLEQMVKTRFAAIADKEVKRSDKPSPLFTGGVLPAKLTVRPLQDQRRLEILFPIPPFEQWYQEKPVEYISYLLGHEGKGSLYQVLRDLGWVESLSAGASESNRQSAAFSIALMLTQEGYNHQDEITAAIFQAIGKLEEKGIEKWRYNEQSVVNESLFRYQEKGDPQNYVATLANNLHYYKSEEVITGDVLMKKFDEALIRQYLGYLKSENALIIVNAPDVPVEKTSTYYQTQYALKKITRADLQRWQEQPVNSLIQLPQPNEFVAKSFKIKKAGEASIPVLLRETGNLSLWFKQDHQFNVPRGSVFVYARSDYSAESTQGAVLTDIFVRLLRSNLNESSYSASLAGLDLGIAKRSRGVELSITGYTDKQGLLLTRVLEGVATPSFNRRDFNRIKEEYLRELQNRNKQTPYRQLHADLSALVSLSDYERAEYLEVAQAVTLESIQAFSLRWLKSLNADVFIHGNFTESDALKLSAIIAGKLGLHGPPHHDPQSLLVHVPRSSQGYIHHLAVDHSDIAMMHYLQGANNSLEEEALLRMLGQLMSADFFDQLRTQQQLGYVVYGDFFPLSHAPGLAFVVQSPTHTAEEIDARITAFFFSFAQTLARMKPEVFERNRQALLLNLAEKPKNLTEEGHELWNEISLRQLSFDRREQLMVDVESIEKKELVDYYAHTLLSADVRRLVMVASKKEITSAKLLKKYSVIDDVKKFKTEKEYFVLD